ncbi:MAG: phosphoribosylglycinamide formyltransferase [Acidimicrobiales bacterium]
MARLCVLVSGSGTILEAMIAAPLDVTLVAADRPCRALVVAADAGVEVLLVDRADYGGFGPEFDRDTYSAVLAAALLVRDIDLVAMAGFGTILAGPFHEGFPGRILNTHPSLLPEFKGWHAVRQAIAAGVAETGCTVHVATESLDDGPILAQRRVVVLEEDDEGSLHERIKSVERTLYPLVVGRVMANLARGLEPVSVVGTLEES